MTDYGAHVQRIEADIQALRREAEKSSGPHSTTELACRLFCRQFQLYSLSGEISHLSTLYDTVAEAVTRSPVRSDLWLVQAYIALKLHRFADAQRLMEVEPERATCPQGLLIQSELDVQQGRYQAARETIRQSLDSQLTWEGLARLAYLTGLLGDVDTADKLYHCAQQELTVKQMHAYAWVEVQRGVLAFQRGKHGQALGHYEKAGRAYSGYWLIAERVAEAKGAQGCFAGAIEEYQRLYAISPRPEWAHALGDLYSLSGAISTAHTWKTRALDQYLQSVSSGGVHYYHYLVDLVSELPELKEQAVQWARKDEKIRSNYQTQGNLAWTLYRCGRVLEAREWINLALQSKVVCARLFLQAACVYSAVGETQRSHSLYRLSLETNAVPAKACLPGDYAASSRAATSSSHPLTMVVADVQCAQASCCIDAGTRSTRQPGQ